MPKMKNILALIFICFSISSMGQNAGSIIGKVLDKDLNNEPLPFANILISDTNFGTTSDFDGLFEINDLMPGNYKVSISYLGYETQTVDLEVVSDKVAEISVSLSAVSNALEEVVVTTVARRDSQTALLLEQKKAVNFKQQIGAQELSQKGISDASDAVVKTSGVSKQEDSGSIYVRGLGDRYNITLYNGFALPSNNPSLKNISLDLFRSDIVESISIDKTYSAENYGDYAGASININAATSKSENYTKFGFSSGLNTSVTETNTFYLNEGPNYIGFYNHTYPNDPLNAYRFETGFDRAEAFSGVYPVNLSGSLESNYGYRIGSDAKINLYAVLNFDNDFNYRNGVNRGSINDAGLAYKDYDYERYQYETNTTGMLNLSFLRSGLKITLSNLFVNSSMQNQQEYMGVIDIFDFAPEGGGFVQRAEYVQTQMLMNQLIGDWTIDEKWSLEGGASLSQLDNSIPDRRQIILTPFDWNDPEGPKSFDKSLNAGDNHRYYQNLIEDEFSYRAVVSYAFDNVGEKPRTALKAGFMGRNKSVAFDATQINHAISRSITQGIINNIYDVDSYFNQANLMANNFSLSTFRGKASNPIALMPQTYDGTQDVLAGFVSLEQPLGDKAKLQLGVRYEDITQTISWSTTLDPTGNTATLSDQQVLPALSVLYALNDSNNLRFAASKTYTLPQFKERAYFQFEEVTQIYLGNPSLYSSTDYNFDLKWEHFPTSSELISLTAFTRIIEDPINDVSVNSASNDISYVNSGDQAMVAGLEFELRKNLFDKSVDTGSQLLKNTLNIGLNASYMYSKQDLDSEKVQRETEASGLLDLSVTFTNSEERLTGASDVLLNLDATYEKDFTQDRSLLTSMSLNYFSDKLYSIGTQGKGNIVDKGVAHLNMTAKYKLNNLIGLKLSAKNLLNPVYKRFQDTQNVTVLTYQKGRSITLGVDLTF